MKSDSVMIAGGRRANARTVECRTLPFFEPQHLEEVRCAFRNAERVSLRQAWRRTQESDFAPGHVHLGWRMNSLFVFAELKDADIFNHATDHNQQTWLMGDTFEMFFRPVEQATYMELHVTPNNHRLQLRYENAAAVSAVKRNRCIQSALIFPNTFHSRVWVRPETEQWFVLGEIPAESIYGETELLAGRQWRFSFGRYDYERTQMKAVLSSSSAHAEPDFHRQEEWGTLVFRPTHPDITQ